MAWSHGCFGLWRGAMAVSATAYGVEPWLFRPYHSESKSNQSGKPTPSRLRVLGFEKTGTSAPEPDLALALTCCIADLTLTFDFARLETPAFYLDLEHHRGGLEKNTTKNTTTAGGSKHARLVCVPLLCVFGFPPGR